MADVVRTDIDRHLLEGLKIVYSKAFKAQPIVWPKLAMRVPSNKETETYGWLGNVPVMREFLDERQLDALAEYGFTITNRKWESTIGVDRDALEDELYGQIKARVNSMGIEAKRHQDQMVVELFKDGFATTCYDGQYFFDTDHSEGDSGTQSNKGTTALSATSLKAGITAMQKIKDDKGKVMGINPNILLVPPDLEWTALELMKSVSLVGSTTADALLPSANVLAGRLEIVVSPYLTDTTDWFLLDTTRGIKPVIFQDRIAPEFKALEGNSDSGFSRDMWQYGVRARYNVGYGMWQFAYGASV